MSDVNIKLIDKDTDLSSIEPLKWDLMIGKRPFYVARIRGYVHCIKGWGEPIDLWCWPRDEEPSYENLIEYDLDEPVAWGLEYRERHYVKTKWGETEIRCGAHTTITRNGEDFYTVGGGRGYSIPKAIAMIAEIKDHPIAFAEIDYDKNVVGRKVWYRSQPAVVTRFIKGQCCVMIEPDGFDHFKLSAEYEGDDLFSEWEEERSLKVDCLKDGWIDWFRE